MNVIPIDRHDLEQVLGSFDNLNCIDSLRGVRLGKPSLG